MDKLDLQDLSNRQLEIMEVLWGRGESSALEVQEILSTRREVTRTTIRTTLERMEKKGWLTHRVIGRTFLYAPTVPREIGVGRRIGNFLDDVFGGEPERFMSALLDFRGLSDGELDRIRMMLNEAKKKNRKKGKGSK